MLLDDYNRVMIIDTEATGIQSYFGKKDEKGNDIEPSYIIEFAYELTAPDRKMTMIKENCVYIKLPESHPKVEDILIDKLDKDGKQMTISSLTGITSDVIEKDGFDMKVAAETIVGRMSKPKTLIVMYNANYDLNMVKSLCQREGIDVDFTSIDVLDLLTVYKDLYSYNKDINPETGLAYGHKLDAAVFEFSKRHRMRQNTHDALADVHATSDLLRAMIEEGVVLRPYINCFGYNPKFGIDEEAKIKGYNYYPQSGYSKKQVFYAISKDVKAKQKALKQSLQQ